MRVEARVVGQMKVNPDDLLMLDHVHEVDADYSDRKLLMLTVVGSRFERCRFERLRLGNASLGAGMELTEYVDCSFDGLRTSWLTGFVRFVRCSFRNVDIKEWRAEYTELVDCVFTGRLRSTLFWGAPLREQAEGRYQRDLRWLEKEGRPVPPGFRELMLRESNEFHGNDFSGAKLEKVSFRGIDLTRQRLPTGDEYLYLPDAAAAIERALATLATQPPGEHHAKVEWFLREVLDREVAFGQRQLLLREKNYGPRAANPDVPIAFKLLRESA